MPASLSGARGDDAQQSVAGANPLRGFAPEQERWTA